MSDGSRALEALADAMVDDMGAALSCALAVIGDRLGLYQELSSAAELTPSALAQRTRLSERMVREWLISQAARGYVDYDPQTGRYRMSAEQTALLADESSSVFLAGGFQLVTAMVKAEEQITEAFRHGRGMLWGQHHPDLPVGLARFQRPGYASKLVDVWIDTVAGLRQTLLEGAVVADIGCGHGHPTMELAAAFPRSRFFGYDNHGPSVEQANRLAARRDLAGRVRFEEYGAGDFPDHRYDVITFFNCMHDVGDPAGCAARCHQTLKPDGCLFMVEPLAGHRVEDNFNPVGRFMTGSSVLCCTPHGMASGGEGLGTIVTDARLEEIITGAGFRTFRRVFTTKYGRIFEGRP